MDTPRMNRRVAWVRDEQGGTAVEFALVLIPVLMLVFAIIHGSLMLYTSAQLKYAAEATARCYAISHTSGTFANCQSPDYETAAKAYFLKMYNGPTAAPNVYPSAGNGCTGYQVKADVDYKIVGPLFSQTVPIKARACFAG